jgi:hypothetical protein
MVRAPEPKVDQVEDVSRLDQAGYPWSETAAGKGGLECKINPLFGQLMYPLKHQSPGFKGDSLRLKSRKPGGNHVGIDEFGYSQRLIQ